MQPLPGPTLFPAGAGNHVYNIEDSSLTDIHAGARVARSGRSESERTGQVLRSPLTVMWDTLIPS